MRCAARARPVDFFIIKEIALIEIAGAREIILPERDRGAERIIEPRFDAAAIGLFAQEFALADIAAGEEQGVEFRAAEGLRRMRRVEGDDSSAAEPGAVFIEACSKRSERALGEERVRIEKQQPIDAAASARRPMFEPAANPPFVFARIRRSRPGARRAGSAKRTPRPSTGSGGGSGVCGAWPAITASIWLAEPSSEALSTMIAFAPPSPRKLKAASSASGAQR